MKTMSAPAKLSWDFVLGLSLVVILAAGWFAFLAPLPAKPQAKKPTQSVAQLQTLATATESKAALAEGNLERRTWNVTAEVLGSEVLSELTRIAAANRLQVMDFRAGRVTTTADLWQASYTALIEGAFPDVMAALRFLESPASKIAVSQLKVASKGTADQVAATVTVSGFLRKEDAS